MESADIALLLSCSRSASSRRLRSALRISRPCCNLKPFEPEQLYALASLSIRSHSYGFGIALIFFGCVYLILGYLIFRSGFLPKAVGVLMQIAGLSYLTNSFALILAPTFANRIFPAILIPAFVGEASLCLWFLVKGVNVEKWEERTSAWPVSGA